MIKQTGDLNMPTGRPGAVQSGSQAARARAGAVGTGGRESEKADFKRVLDRELNGSPGLKFSAHALNRLRSRGIDIDPTGLRRIEEAVQRASAKGSREALVLFRDLALVVSVTNRVIITAMDGESMKQNVFTNIDSVVIA